MTIKEETQLIPVLPTRDPVIGSPHIAHILAGEKTWEMRSRNCRIRGPIGLIRKGSGKLVGLAEITGVVGPLSLAEMLANQDKHRISHARLTDPSVAKWNRAWVLSNVKALVNPVPYVHPNGAQSWIVLDEKAAEGLRKVLGRGG